MKRETFGREKLLCVGRDRKKNILLKCNVQGEQKEKVETLVFIFEKCVQSLASGPIVGPGLFV